MVFELYKMCVLINGIGCCVIIVNKMLFSDMKLIFLNVEFVMFMWKDVSFINFFLKGM